MARVPTERVTVRLNKQHLATIDALVQIGEIRNRTHAISEAVKDWIKQKAVGLKTVEESARSQIEVQTLAARLAQMQSQLEKLTKK